MSDEAAEDDDLYNLVADIRADLLRRKDRKCALCGALCGVPVGALCQPMLCGGDVCAVVGSRSRAR